MSESVLSIDGLTVALPSVVRSEKRGLKRIA